MKLILSLLKKILVSLSDFYRKDYVNAELDKRVDSTVFTSSLGDETAERKRVDLEISASIDDNEANDEALAKVIEWQGYVDQICRSVDDDVAIAFAEEFEKATLEYLADPTAEKEWVTNKNPDGTITSTNPYYATPPTKPVVDFNVTKAEGFNNSGTSVASFVAGSTFPIFLPCVTDASRMFGNTNVDAPIVALSATNCRAMLTGTPFNSSLIIPKAENCQDLFARATKYNQRTALNNATMLSGAFYYTLQFNSEVVADKATNVYAAFSSAPKFNSKFSFKSATYCDRLLNSATAFNQSFTLPSATHCVDLCNGASSLDQPVYLHSCINAQNAFKNTAMSAENISATLDSLPTWTDGASHVITFTGCPGIASTATTETFTVTDDDGTEFSLENCPIFDTDDENQTLRKAFVLAVVKKGWTIEMTDSAPYKRELAYLQATGTQWIDTGVACIMNTTAEYSVEVDTDSEISINTYELTGVGSGWYFGLIGRGENRKNWTINTSTSGTMETPGVVADTVYTVVQTWQSNTLTTTISDGSDTGTNSRSVSPSSSNQFRLFGLYQASGNSYACKCLRIKSAKYTQDGVLVRDFIPVLDGSGIPCMYDKVSGELFANKGTGTFAYGELDSEAAEVAKDGTVEL